MGFFRHENRCGVPFLSLGDLPNSGIKPVTPADPALQEDSLPTVPSGLPATLLDYSALSTNTFVFCTTKAEQHTRPKCCTALCLQCCFFGHSWRKVFSILFLPSLLLAQSAWLLSPEPPIPLALLWKEAPNCFAPSSSSASPQLISWTTSSLCPWKKVLVVQ